MFEFRFELTLVELLASKRRRCVCGPARDAGWDAGEDAGDAGRQRIAARAAAALQWAAAPVRAGCAPGLLA